MALKDFLFRCPGCGHTPTVGKGDRVSCPSCGLRVDREGARQTRLRVSTRHGESRHLPAALLADRIETLGGAFREARGPDGGLRASAQVRLRVAGGEDPVRYRGRLLGFAERFLGGTPGILSLTPEAVSFLPVVGEGRDAGRTDRREGAHPPERESGAAPRSWRLEEIRALQTSSSAIQLTVPGKGRPEPSPGVLLFRFEEESPRKWDELLRLAISARRERLGLGRVVEFQPRIRGGVRLREPLEHLR